MDVIQNVPFFPPEGRSEELQDLVDEGFVQEVRALESMSDTDLTNTVTAFKDTLSAWLAKTDQIRAAGESVDAFASTSAGQDFRKGLQEKIRAAGGLAKEDV